MDSLSPCGRGLGRGGDGVNDWQARGEAPPLPQPSPPALSPSPLPRGERGEGRGERGEGSQGCRSRGRSARRCAITRHPPRSGRSRSTSRRRMPVCVRRCHSRRRAVRKARRWRAGTRLVRKAGQRERAPGARMPASSAGLVTLSPMHRSPTSSAPAPYPPMHRAPPPVRRAAPPVQQATAAHRPKYPTAGRRRRYGGLLPPAQPRVLNGNHGFGSRGPAAPAAA